MSARLFLKSRWVAATLVGCLIWEGSLLIWGSPAIVIAHGGTAIAVPLIVLAQIVPSMLMVYASGSRTQSLEQLAGRQMWPWRLLTSACLGVVVAAAALAVSLALGPRGTMSVYAAPVTLAGLYGCGLCAATVVDRRLAGAIGTLPLLVPLTLSVDRLPLVELWSFAISARGVHQTVLVAGCWLVAGILCSTALGGRWPLRPRKGRT